MIARRIAGVAADVDAVEEDRVLDQGVAVDPHARREDAAVDLAARDDRPLADDRVERRAPAVGVGVDELGRRDRAAGRCGSASRGRRGSGSGRSAIRSMLVWK